MILFESFGDGEISELDYQYKLDMYKSRMEINEDQQNELIVKLTAAEEKIKKFYNYIDKLSNIDTDQHPLDLIRAV